MPQKGKIIANYDNPYIREILENVSNLIFYTQKEELPEKINNIYKFSYIENQLFLPIGKANPKIFGFHNYSNILASSLLLKNLNIEENIIIEGINEFPGVLRRQQLRKKILFDEMFIEFYEDFAHHPTAVFETIKAFKNHFQNALLIACFEPRSASSHRNTFQKEYSKAFLYANAVYICEIYDPKKVESDQRLNVKQIIEDIKIYNPRAYYCQNPPEVFLKLKRSFLDYCVFAKKHNYNRILILCMSNGNFGNIYADIENWMEKLASIDQ